MPVDELRVNGAECGAVVLAAGEASRFGSPKLLMPFGGSTVVGSVVDSLACAGIAPIVVVAGANSDGISGALAGQPVRFVSNPNPSAGMISSIRVGVEALPTTLKRFVIALGDQPRIGPNALVNLIAGQIDDKKGISIPTYQGKRGHPVVFDIQYRQEILGLSDQQTLRDLIDSHRDDVLEVSCKSDGYVSDIDTREDYERELQRWRDGK